MTILEMIVRRKEIEMEMDKIDEVINYLSEKYDDLLDELKDLDSDLEDIEHTIIRGEE